MDDPENVNPMVLPDRRVVFRSYADLETWASRWCETNREQFEPTVRYAAVAEAKPITAAEDSPRIGPPPRLTLGVTPHAGPQWTTDLTREFLTSIGERSRNLAKCAATLGRTGMLAKEFGEKIDSSVIGLGKRFAKLERDAAQFGKNLPRPARLGGRQGGRVLEVDPAFAVAYRELLALNDPLTQ